MASGGSHLYGGRLKMMSVREMARADLKELLGSSSIKKVTNVPKVILLLSFVHIHGHLPGCANPFYLSGRGWLHKTTCTCTLIKPPTSVKCSYKDLLT